MPSVSAAEIYAALPDEHFPHMPGHNEGAGPLIDLPHRGNQLHVRCLTCGRERDISGRRLAVEFTAYLRTTTARFVSALRCSACGGRRLLAFISQDPGASGFQLSTMDDGRAVFTRRLDTWLAEVGEKAADYVDVLRDFYVPGETA